MTPVELYSPEFFADPYAFYGELRERESVFWHQEQRMWILTRYADVNLVARRPQVFSSRLSALDPLDPNPAVRQEDLPLQKDVDAVHVQEFIQQDPPLHRDKRNQVAARFSPNSLEAMRSEIRGIIDTLLDGVAADSGMDVLAAVARPLPLLVVSRLMGIPDADVQMLAEQARKRMAAVLSLQDTRLRISVEGFRETSDYLGPAIDERLAESAGCPMRSDVLGDMASAESSGGYSRAESLANAMMIIDAGHETTIQLICNGTLQLLRHPQAWAQLVADPAGVAPGAVEESLRFDPPLHALRRIVAQDIEVGERVLRRGDRVLAVIASANRDPRRFQDPESFDILRQSNPHLAFGAGAHFCLGQYLAKLEGREYFAALAERFPHARLQPDHPVTYSPTPRVRSVTRLPVSWS